MILELVCTLLVTCWAAWVPVAADGPVLVPVDFTLGVNLTLKEG